jgi:hypothetical protein
MTERLFKFVVALNKDDEFVGFISEHIYVNVNQEEEPDIVGAAKMEVIKLLNKKIRKYERMGYVQQGKMFTACTGVNGR